MTDMPEPKPLGYLSPTQQRTIITIIGLVIMGLAALPQLPFMSWSFKHGVSHGFDSGKSSLFNSWTIIMLVIDLAALSTWLYFRPRHAAWIIAPPIVMFASMLIAIPLSFVLSAIVHFFMSL